MSRVPPLLLGGRLRTSTAGLSLLFVAVFVLYLLVRPAPVGPVGEAYRARLATPKPRPSAVATPSASPRAEASAAPLATEAPSGPAPTDSGTASPLPSRSVAPTAAPTSTTPALPLPVVSATP